MASLNSKIFIERELRPCKIKIDNNEYKNALFHMFDTDGNAVLEFEGGTVSTYNGDYVVFLDNKFKDYSF